MKKETKKILNLSAIFLSGISFCSSALAQDTYVYALITEGPQDSLVAINLSDGEQKTIAVFSNHIEYDKTAYDGVHKKYYVVGEDENFDVVLYSVNVETGTKSHSSSFSSFLDAFEFDNTTSTLYAYDGTTDHLVQVNVNTGLTTMVADLSNVTYTLLGTHTFDEANGRYIFDGFDASTNFAIYSVDVSNGNITKSSSYPGNVNSLEFDNDAEVLYAFTASAELITIDLTTGATTTLGSIPNTPEMNESTSAFDDVNKSMVVLGRVTLGWEKVFVAETNPFSVASIGANYGWNSLRSIQFAGSGITFPTIISEHSQLSRVNLFPNPVTSTLWIEADDKVTENNSLVIKNMAGQIVLNKELSETTKASFDLGFLPDGTYIVNVLSERSLIKNKIIKISE